MPAFFGFLRSQNSVYQNVAVFGFLPLLITEMADQSRDDDGFVQLGAIPFKAESFALTALSFSVAVQAVMFISLGAFADFGSLRLAMLKWSAVGGALSTMAILFLTDSSLWWLAGALAVASNTLFGISFVVYNAFLPKLVQAHPDVVAAKHEGRTREEVFELEEQLANRLSTNGVTAGAASGVLLLLVAVAITIAAPETGAGTVTSRDQHELVRFDSELVSQGDHFRHRFLFPGSFGFFDRDPKRDHPGVLVEGVVRVRDLPGAASLRALNASAPGVFGGFHPAPGGAAAEPDPDAIVHITFGYHHPPGLDNVTEVAAGTTVQWNFDQGGDTTSSPRLVIFLSGLWWLLFSLPVFKYLRPRPGPPLSDALAAARRRPGPSSSGAGSRAKAGLAQAAAYIAFSWRRMFRTLSMARHFPNTIRFLVSYFVFSDGYSTITTVGLLFGRGELGMTTAELALIALEVPLFAIAGNFFFVWLQKRTGMSSRNMVALNLSLIGFLPVYAMLGFVEGVGIGLRHKNEMFIFAAFYGFNLGSVESFSRVVFSELIPTGKESELFSLYEITDKGSSWLGPLVVAGLFQATGSLRYGFFYLLFTLLAPLVLLLRVDVFEGKLHARTFTMKVEQATHGLVRQVSTGSFPPEPVLMLEDSSASSDDESATPAVTAASTST